MKILATVFSLGSLTCEFQMFYILLSAGESFIILFYSTYLEVTHYILFSHLFKEHQASGFLSQVVRHKGFRKL